MIFTFIGALKVTENLIAGEGYIVNMIQEVNSIDPGALVVTAPLFSVYYPHSFYRGALRYTHSTDDSPADNRRLNRKLSDNLPCHINEPGYSWCPRFLSLRLYNLRDI